MAKTNKEAVEETVEVVKEVAAEAAKKAKKSVEQTAKKTAVEAKRVAESAKKTASKVLLKETFIQFAGREIRESEIMEKVEEAYKAEGHRLSSVRSLELYIKPEENAAYYVINGKTTGKVEL